MTEMTSFHEAIERSRSNPHAHWPDRAAGRLEPFANPDFRSGLSLQPGAKVMTMGSCFARNIEEFFHAEGFDVPLMRYTAPAGEFDQGARIQGILNKYTLASIATEIEWLARVKAEGGVVTWDNVSHMFLELRDGSLLDLQLATTVGVPRDRAIERRQQIYDVHVQIFDCDVAVLTPGLTESWFDNKTGYYIQRIPTPRQGKAEPDRFTFGVMDFFECFERLDRTIRLLKDNGTRQIGLTVSPVPLHRTMTDQDIIIANSYSKSTLRSVVGLICERHDGVFYVPSYERVMLSKNEEVWNDDLRHVSDKFVATIAARFAAAALGRPLEPEDETQAFEQAVQEGRIDDAVRTLDTLGPQAANSTAHGFIRSACSLYVALGRWEDALPFAQRLQVLKPHLVGGYKYEYDIQIHLGNDAAARATAERAIALCKGATMKTFTGGDEK